MFKKVLCFISLYICFVSTSVYSKTTQVDLLITNLQGQTWLQEETNCLSDTLNILDNVKNHTIWAVWIWNSMHHPTGTFYGSRYNFGNYDQCMNAPSVITDPKFLMQYCLVDVKLTNDEEQARRNYEVFDKTDQFLKTRSEVGRNFNILTWGTCLPASCSPNAIAKIIKSMYLVNPLASADPEVVVDSCQVAGESTEYSVQLFLFIALVASLIGAAFISTYYLKYSKEDTKLTRIAYSFSLQRNWSSFVKTTSDEIPVLSYSKSVQFVLATVVHSFVFGFMGPMSNGSDVDDKEEGVLNSAATHTTFQKQSSTYVLLGYQAVNNILLFLTTPDDAPCRSETYVEDCVWSEFLNTKKRYLGYISAHIDLPSLENFFVISGFLVMKGLMEKKKTPIVSLIQRYIRLIGSFSIIIFFSAAVFKYTGDGPLWNKFVREHIQPCEENWSWSLLMLNNYVNSEGICQIVGWYVPCDYQLAIMATVLFAIWQWNPKIGKITAIIVSFLALVLPGVVTYWNRYPGIIMYNIEKMIDVRHNVVYLHTYIRGHNRAGPYLIGMATGYIMTKYKPDRYQRIISKTWSYIGYIVASIIALGTWASASYWCLGDYNVWNSAIYASLNRNIWAIATCMCILISTYGDLPEIQSIIAWPGFAIYSRLAYGVYITHSLLLQRNIYVSRNPMHFDMCATILNGLGLVTASSIMAILLWLFVEAPLINLTNLILIPRKKDGNGIIKGNEINSQTVVHDKKNGKQL